MVDCIILAGGLGTRLRSVINNVPKPLADINGKPFLEWQLEHLQKQGINRVILSTGYKGHMIKSYFGSRYNELKIIYSHENHPLGTGGAILNALEKVKSNSFLVLNGDTFFPIDYEKIFQSAEKFKNAIMIMAVFFANRSEQYGAISINIATKNLINLESSKSKIGEPANGGIYLCDAEKWRFFSKALQYKKVYSLENDLIPMMLDEKHQIFCEMFDTQLLDIGTPGDYLAARKNLTTNKINC